MNRYYKFMISCEKEFVREIHGLDKPIKFRNKVEKCASLEELKALDNFFINRPEDDKPEANDNER